MFAIEVLSLLLLALQVICNVIPEASEVPPNLIIYIERDLNANEQDTLRSADQRGDGAALAQTLLHSEAMKEAPEHFSNTVLLNKLTSYQIYDNRLVGQLAIRLQLPMEPDNPLIRETGQTGLGMNHMISPRSCRFSIAVIRTDLENPCEPEKTAFIVEQSVTEANEEVVQQNLRARLRGIFSNPEEVPIWNGMVEFKTGSRLARMTVCSSEQPRKDTETWRKSVIESLLHQSSGGACDMNIGWIPVETPHPTPQESDEDDPHAMQRFNLLLKYTKMNEEFEKAIREVRLNNTESIFIGTYFCNMVKQAIKEACQQYSQQPTCQYGRHYIDEDHSSVYAQLDLEMPTNLFLQENVEHVSSWRINQYWADFRLFGVTSVSLIPEFPTVEQLFVQKPYEKEKLLFEVSVCVPGLQCPKQLKKTVCEFFDGESWYTTDCEDAVLHEVDGDCRVVTMNMLVLPEKYHEVKLNPIPWRSPLLLQQHLSEKISGINVEFKRIRKYNHEENNN